MKEMKREERYSDTEFYLNEEKNRRVAITECNQEIGHKQMYSVRVIEVDENGNCRSGETVATRCTHSQAMAIAREYYFK